MAIVVPKFNLNYIVDNEVGRIANSTLCIYSTLVFSYLWGEIRRPVVDAVPLCFLNFRGTKENLRVLYFGERFIRWR